MAYETVDTDESGRPIAVQTVGAVEIPVVRLDVGDEDSEGPVGDGGAALPVEPVDRVVTGTIDADEETVAISCEGAGTVAIGIVDTSGNGTLVAEATHDDSNWFLVSVWNDENRNADGSTVPGGDFVGRFVNANYSQVRIRADAWTSGSVAVTLRAVPQSQIVQVYQERPVLVAADDPLEVEGNLRVDSSTVNFAPQATAASIPVALPSDQAPLTVNLGAVDNAVLDDIAAQATAIKTAAEVLDNTVGTHDAAVPAGISVVGGRASSVVPSAVDADGDAVRAWLNRNGAAVVADLPHIGVNADPFTLTGKTAQFTTQQTGTALWTPAGGKKLVITKVQIQAGGTTAGAVQLWFGASGDTTYSRGTDLAIFDGEFAPSATLKPGVVDSGPWVASAADHILRVTDSAAVNPLTVTCWGYEI